MPTCTCFVAGEQVGAAATTARWSRFNRHGDHQRPGAAATLLQKVQPRLAGGFISAELVAAAAAASIFALDGVPCTGRVQAWTSEPPARLLPSACEHGWPGT